MNSASSRITASSSKLPTMFQALERLRLRKAATETLQRDVLDRAARGALRDDEAAFLLASLKQDMDLLNLAEEYVMTEATSVSMLTLLPDP